MQQTPDELLDGHFELFSEYLAVENDLNDFKHVAEFSERNTVLQGELDKIRKRAMGTVFGGTRKSRSDIFPFERKPVPAWTAEDVIAWLKLIGGSFVSEAFFSQFVVEDRYEIQRLLDVDENTRSLIQPLRSKIKAMKFLLNLKHVKECYDQATHIKKDFFVLVEKIIRKPAWNMVNLEDLYSYLEWLSDFYELKDLLVRQEFEEVSVSVVFTKGWCEREAVTNALSVEVSEEIWDEEVGSLGVKKQAPAAEDESEGEARAAPPVKPSYYAGVLVGSWYFEWNKTSLVAPRIFPPSIQKNLVCVEVKKIERSTYIDACDALINAIIGWNLTYQYDLQSRNSSHWVDTVLKMLNVSVYDPILIKYLKGLLATGSRPDVPKSYVKEILSWNLADCITWLERISFREQVQKLFQQRRITGRTMVELSLDDPVWKSLFPVEVERQSFLIFLCHMQRNVTERRILKYDTDFYLFARRFLTNQSKNEDRLRVRMNFFDLESSFHKFSNKHQLMEYYLPFVPDDGVSVVIVRKDRTYQSGVLIGSAVLHWKPSELLVPKIVMQDDLLRYFKIDLDATVGDVFSMSSKVANVILLYNAYHKFDPKQRGARERNCQMFVDDLLEAIGLQEQLEEMNPAAKAYLDKMRRNGRNDAQPDRSMRRTSQRLSGGPSAESSGSHHQGGGRSRSGIPTGGGRPPH